MITTYSSCFFLTTALEMFLSKRGFGNLILWRIRPTFMKDHGTTHAIVANFISQPPASAHLMSLPWLNEEAPHREIQAISSWLRQISRTVDEFPVVVNLGSTWDATRNTIISQYLSPSNLYNGFSSGSQRENRIRLDRAIVPGETISGHKAEAWLRDVHRCLPWEDYLTPSSHFGAASEIPARARTE